MEGGKVGFRANPKLKDYATSWCPCDSAPGSRCRSQYRNCRPSSLKRGGPGHPTAVSLREGRDVGPQEQPLPSQRLPARRDFFSQREERPLLRVPESGYGSGPGTRGSGLGAAPSLRGQSHPAPLHPW